MTRQLAALAVLLIGCAQVTHAQWPGAQSDDGIAFRPGQRFVVVTWAKMDSAGAYHVYRSTDSTTQGSDLSGALQATTYQDNSLQLGKVYFYHIVADPKPGMTAGSRPGSGPPKPRHFGPQRFMLSAPGQVAMPSGRKP